MKRRSRSRSRGRMNSKPEKRKSRKVKRKNTRKRRTRVQRGGLNITDVNNEAQQHAFLDLAKNYNWGEVLSTLESVPLEHREFLLNVRPRGRWSALNQAQESDNTEIVAEILKLVELEPEPAPEPEMVFPHGSHPFTPEVLADKSSTDIRPTPLDSSVLDSILGDLTMVESVSDASAVNYMGAEYMTDIRIYPSLLPHQVDAVRSLFTLNEQGGFVHIHGTGGGAMTDGAGPARPARTVRRMIQTDVGVGIRQDLTRVDSEQPISMPGVIAIWNGGKGNSYIICKSKIKEDLDNSQKVLESLRELESNPLYKLREHDSSYLNHYTKFSDFPLSKLSSL